jgi:aryl-alcohol dehydrogenase-like predicted oxidoreductase
MHEGWTMKRFRLPGTTLEVSTFCLGAASFGDTLCGEALDEHVNAFRDAGGAFLDTAHVYAAWSDRGAGASERALAGYFARNGGRDEMVVATKGGHPTFRAYTKPDRYLGLDALSSDIDESLQRLRVDAIDLFYLHRDDPRLGVEEIVDSLNELVGRGKVRWLGASNWTVQRIERANEYARAHGLAGFVISQPEGHLACSIPASDQTFLDADALAWHRRTGLAAACYGSTARGFFATGVAPKRLDNETSRQRLARARRLAEGLGCTAHQVAVAWLLAQPFWAIPILGTTHPRHLREAMDAEAISLTDRQREWLYHGGPEAGVVSSPPER